MSTSSLLSAIILIALLSPSSCNYRLQLIDYIVNLIHYLQSQHHGFFQIWFYHAASNIIPSDPILEEIQSTLDLIPRMSLNTFDSRWVLSERQPIPLVIIHIESVLMEQERWMNFTRLLIAMDSHSRVLILTSFDSPDVSLEILVLPFLHSKTFNAVYLSLDRELYVFYDFLRKNLTILTEFPSFERLFPNPARDLNGMRIRISAPRAQMINKCHSGNDCTGYDIAVIDHTARYVNASVVFVKLNCKGQDECDLQTLGKLSLDVVNCPFDIYVDLVYARQRFRNYLVLSPLLTNDAFLVPRGRSLNVVELFIMPFRFEVWILLLCGLVAIKTASLFMAGGFRNDVLLLPICGFERFDLNRASRIEKTVIFSMVVLFFFVTNAYESKFTSLMTTRPPAYEINTLDDIQRMGLTVKASRNRAGLLLGYDFNYLFAEDVNYTDSRMDGVSVYLTHDRRAEAALLRPENWDFESNQPRYKMLEQRLGLQISFYIVAVRSLVKPAFEHVQNMLFEAGVLQLWFTQFLNLFYANGITFTKNIPEEGFAPNASILKFSDLLPLWNILALGCFISLLVFVIELSSNFFTKFTNAEMM